MDRIAIAVDAEEGEVKVVAWIAEVVGVAAEEGGALLGRAHQPDVGVLPVAIHPVLATVVEVDHARLKSGALLGFLFDLRLHGAMLVVLRALARMGIDRPSHPGGDVFHGLEHPELEIRTLELLRLAAREESLPHVVLLRGRDLLELAERDVMVGHHQAVGRDERPRAAAEVDRGLLDALDPRRRDGEAVGLLEALGRQVVERPHAFVGVERRGGKPGRRGEQQRRGGPREPAFHGRPRPVGGRRRGRSGRKRTPDFAPTSPLKAARRGIPRCREG